MGCASSNPEARKYLKAPTLFGELKVTIINCHLQRNTNSVMTMDPYVKLIMSNQTHKTQVIKKGGFDPRFDYQCSFFVNSCYKPYGRSLQMFVMDKNIVASDKIIGYGLMDLDPIIKKSQEIHDIKVRLNFEFGQVGIINLKLQFIEHPYDTISFRFQSLDVTKRTNIVGTMNCWVRLTIGEEVMQTQKIKDTPQCPPIWKDQVFMMEVPNCIRNVVIETFDQKKLIGKGEYPVSAFNELPQQELFRKNVKGQDQTEAGIIEFSVVRGKEAQFAPNKRIHKKAQPQQEINNQQKHRKQDKNQKSGKKEDKQWHVGNEVKAIKKEQIKVQISAENQKTQQVKQQARRPQQIQASSKQ